MVSNSVCLLKLNRLHAIARGDLYADCMRGRAPEKWETPQRFARFWLCFFASKALMTVISAGSFVYYALHLAGRETATRTHDGILHGGSLLSRYGALCDGASIHFEDSFPGRYRCHITREPVMIYLQSQVYAFGGALLLIMLAMLGALAAFFGDYRKWQHEAALQRNRPSSRLSPGDGPDASLVRSLRVAVRVAIGYFSAEPPDGLPDLLAKVIVGKTPTKEELGTLVGRLLSADKPLPGEVADLLYAVMSAAMGRGVGDAGEMKELLLAAAGAWGDAERQQYMRGMLAVLRQQNNARRQTSPIGGGGGASE